MALPRKQHYVFKGKWPILTQRLVSLLEIGGMPKTPDPNTSAKVSRYKWEAYSDTKIGGVYTTFCQKEGIFLQKHRDKNRRCVAILFKSYRGQGSIRLS